MAAPLVIVIAVRNGAETLGSQLEALCDSVDPGTDFEVVVVDNGSSDGSRSIAEGFGERLRLRIVDAPLAVGAGAARNQGVAATEGEQVLFCDADDVVDARWLEAMVRAFEAGGALLVGPIDYVALNDPVVRAWRGADRAFAHSPLGFRPAGHSSNLGIRRDVFQAIGGFDEAYAGAGCEDIDLCWRAQQHGAALVEVPDAVVHYRLRPTLRATWRQSMTYTRGESWLYKKHRRAGARRRPVGRLVRDLWWLVSRAPLLVLRDRRGSWVRHLAEQAGRVVGAIEHRTIWW